MLRGAARRPTSSADRCVVALAVGQLVRNSCGLGLLARLRAQLLCEKDESWWREVVVVVVVVVMVVVVHADTKTPVGGRAKTPLYAVFLR